MKTQSAFGWVTDQSVAVALLLVLSGLCGHPSPAQERPPTIVISGQQTPEPTAGINEFFDAIQGNNTNRVAQMLASNTNLIRARWYGRLPLHMAASEGHGEIVGLLLNYGADINEPGDTPNASNAHFTALDAAIMYNHPAVCRRLLEAGANPNVLGPWEGGALHIALSNHRDEIAGWLLDHGADPFLEGGHPYRKSVPFWLAITSSDGKLIPRILKESRLIAGTLKPGAELLLDGKLVALKPAAVKFLAARGTEVLLAAAQRGELEAVEALLEIGVSAKATFPEGVPLLQSFALSEAGAEKAKDFPAQRWAKVRALLEKNGARCDALAATGLGDVETVRRLLAANSNTLRITDQLGQTPLHWAVLTDRLPFTSFWLEAGVSPAATNASGQTALHLAIAQRLPRQVERLLAAGAAKTARDNNGRTPLDLAIQNAQPETIRLLLDKTANASHPERGVATPLHQAAAEGNLVTLAAFVNATNIEARDELGLTPLHLAARAGQLGAAALLLDQGADINARDPNGSTVLHLIMLGPTQWLAGQPSAAWVEHMKKDPHKEKFLRTFAMPIDHDSARPVARTVAFLLACGADAAATNNAGETILTLAMRQETRLPDEEYNLLVSLLRQGSSSGLEERDAKGETALHRALRDAHSGNKAAHLIAGGANINATNLMGRTPLHVAFDHLWSWGSEPLEAILKAKPDMNAQDSEGFTPLHALAASDCRFKAEATKVLLDAGANPNARDKHGRTPAHLLLTRTEGWNAEQCFAMVVAAGADLSLADDEGQTPLHYLGTLGRVASMFLTEALAKSFPSTNLDTAARDHYGDTPAHIAARNGASEVLNWLAGRGASLDTTNNAGETPRGLAARSSDAFARFRFGSETDMFQAAREGKVEPLAALLKTDPTIVNLTNQFGQSLLRTAVQAHRTNVVALLEAKGARWDAATAVMADRADVLRGILAREPAALASNLYGRDLLHLAAAGGHVEVTTMLLQAGAGLQACDSWGLSPLGAALLQKRAGMADLLIRRGAAENLFDATYCGHLPAATALLSTNKSLARATNRYGASVLEVAISASHEDLVKLLLSKGAAADRTCPSDGRTPLHIAAYYNRAGAADLLIRKGARVDVIDLSGYAPLHLAVFRGSAEVTAVLLKHKADPRLPTAPASGFRQFGMAPGQQYATAGSAPMHLAALVAQTNVIPLLLKAGASVNATNTAGNTALDLVSLQPMSLGMFGIEHGLRMALEPPGFGESTPLRSFSLREARRQAAVSLLESAGGKRSPERPPGQGTFGW